MADQSQKLAIIVTAQDLASGKLSKVRSELASMGTSGKIASVGIGAGMLAVNKGEQALGNFKNRLTSLAAPLAMIGVTGGLFSLGGALEQGVSKASALALATEKVTSATGLGTHAASQAVAVFGNFGVSADTTATTLGRLEKNAFTAANTAKLAAKFQTEYGLSLVDGNGKVKDASALPGTLSDYYNSNTNIAQRDAAMSKLLGKSWIDLVPILQQGSKGYADAAAQADKMGTTLKDSQDPATAQKFIAAERLAGQAVSGLETQLGLLVMPDITSGLTAFSSWVANHEDDIKSFFESGLRTAEQLGGFITGTVVPAISSVAGAASKVWGMIPGPMQDLLVKGFVADRTMKFFFGMSPIHAVVSLAEGAIQKGLSGLVSGLFTRGSSPANPMFVQGTGIGGGGGGPGNVANDVTTAAEDAGGGALAVGNTGAMLTGGAVLAGAALSVGAVAAVGAVAIDQYSKLSNQGDALAAQASEFVKTATLPELLRGQAAVETGVKQLIDQGAYNPLTGAGESGLSKAGQIIAAAIDARTSHFGGSGGMVGQDQYAPKTSTMAQSKQLAADMRQGFMPTLSQINAELKTNRQIVQGQAAANARARSDEHKDLASMGSTTMKSAFLIVAAIQAMQAALAGRFILNSPSLTQVPVRDVNTSSRTRASLGPDRRIGGSNSTPVRS